MYIDGDALPKALDNSKIEKRYKLEQKLRRLENEVRRAKRKAEGFSDPDNIKKANKELREAQKKLRDFIDKVNAEEGETVFKHDYGREKIYSENIDILHKSGIIEETSKKPITQITDSAIERVPKVDISDYTDKQCEIIQKQHKELLEYSRQNNDNKEVAFVFDGDLNNHKEFIGTDDKLDFGSTLYGKDLFVMHNHPRNSSYSDTDIAFLLSSANIKALSIVKNNGLVEVLTKTSDFNKDALIIDFKRQYKKYVKTGSDAEIDKAVRKFISNNKEGLEWKESK